MEDIQTDPKSPIWGPTTKLVIGLTFVAVGVGLMVRFQSLVGPLILSFVLSYLLHPVATFVSSRTGLSWRMAVNIIFLVLIVVIVSSFTASGVAIVNQLQNLVEVVQRFVTDLPELMDSLTTHENLISIPILNYEFDVTDYITQLDIDLLALSEQILSIVQPMLGQAGGLLRTLATSALNGLGWGAFIFIIAYFILADAGEVPDFLRGIDLPGHMDDLRRLGRKISRIWNAFLRGQMLLFAMIIGSSFILMTILGVRNPLGLAFLTGLAKFVPYVGPLIAGITTALVAFFQGGNYLGFEQFTFALVVVISSIVLDQIFDNLVTPRLFGQTLGVHPAAVLVSAIILANFIGFIGLLLAAPVLATVLLFVKYALRKMVDLEPWPDTETEIIRKPNPIFTKIQAIFLKLTNYLRKNKNDKERSEK